MSKLPTPDVWTHIGIVSTYFFTVFLKAKGENFMLLSDKGMTRVTQTPHKHKEIEYK